MRWGIFVHKQLHGDHEIKGTKRWSNINSIQPIKSETGVSQQRRGHGHFQQRAALIFSSSFAFSLLAAISLSKSYGEGTNCCILQVGWPLPDLVHE